MRRRDFIRLIGRGAAGWPLAAHAQQPAGKVMRIGLLMSYRGGDQEGQQRLAAFRESLKQAGWVDGVTVRIEVRWFAGDPEQASCCRCPSTNEVYPNCVRSGRRPRGCRLRRKSLETGR